MATFPLCLAHPRALPSITDPTCGVLSRFIHIFAVQRDENNRFPRLKAAPLPVYVPCMSEQKPVTPARIWFRFLRLHQRSHAAMTQRLKALGLSVAQFDLISTLTEAEGITQRDLAERLYVTKGNVSGLVDRLVEAGLVDRRAIPGDRRSYALHLTPEGQRLAAAGMKTQQNLVEQTLGKLPEGELMQLDKLFSRWRDHLKTVE